MRNRERERDRFNEMRLETERETDRENEMRLETERMI